MFLSLATSRSSPPMFCPNQGLATETHPKRTHRPPSIKLTFFIFAFHPKTLSSTLHPKFTSLRTCVPHWFLETGGHSIQAPTWYIPTTQDHITTLILSRDLEFLSRQREGRNENQEKWQFLRSTLPNPSTQHAQSPHTQRPTWGSTRRGKSCSTTVARG